MRTPDGRPEPLRVWYTRSTRKAIRSLLAATVIAVLGMVAFWVFVPPDISSRIQTANGAYTIPMFGGLWIAAFMFIWLIPMRELSFRGQESLDRTEDRMKDTIARITPVVEVWERVGKKVEGEILPKFDKMIDEARAAIRETRDRVGPASASVRRVENIVEGKIGVLSADVQSASHAIQKFFGPQGAPPDPEAAARFMRAPTNGRYHEQGVQR